MRWFLAKAEVADHVGIIKRGVWSGEGWGSSLNRAVCDRAGLAGEYPLGDEGLKKVGEVRRRWVFMAVQFWEEQE